MGSVLECPKTSQDTMCSVAVGLFTLLIVVVGGNSTDVSNRAPYRRDDRPLVICNTVQDSHCHEAMKSLEASLLAALEKKLEHLTAALNKTSGKVSFSL